jgi:hypothetical protein
MDPETGAGQVSARCAAMKASIWAATWAFESPPNRPRAAILFAAEGTRRRFLDAMVVDIVPNRLDRLWYK